LTGVSSGTYFLRVRVLNPSNAAIVRYIRTGTAATAMAVDSLHGWAYVATAGPVDAHDRYVGPGTVSVVDEHTARVVRQVRVPANPLLLILATRHQRLLAAAVANGPDGMGEGTVSVVATTFMTGRTS
jgi:DNA-binding beta-propeller fold protein YncE